MQLKVGRLIRRNSCGARVTADLVKDDELTSRHWRTTGTLEKERSQQGD